MMMVYCGWVGLQRENILCVVFIVSVKTVVGNKLYTHTKKNNTPKQVKSATGYINTHTLNKKKFVIYDGIKMFAPFSTVGHTND